MPACEESASMLCARLMRGTRSRLNALTFRFAQAGNFVGCRWLDFENGVTGEGRRRVGHIRAGVDVGGVAEERRLTSAGFDHDLDAGLHQAACRLRHDGDATLTGQSLLRNANLHCAQVGRPSRRALAPGTWRAKS